MAVPSSERAGADSARTQLGVDDFAGAIRMQRTRDSADDTCDLGFFRGESTLARQQDGGKKPEDKRAAGNATDGGDQQHHRSEETTVRAQQVSHSAEPAKKCGKGEAIERGYAAGRMTVRAVRHVKMVWPPR